MTVDIADKLMLTKKFMKNSATFVDTVAFIYV